MPTEQMERRRQGLYLNCDESYARGHICKRLFYLETVDEPGDAVGEEGDPTDHLTE
jgi:hypothetical protein